jgi:hypothetical protein
MRKLAACRVVGALAVLGTVGAVATAQAEKPKLPKAPKIHPVTPNVPHRCVAHPVGYNASGTLVAAVLSPTGPGRYSGTLTVDVTKVNHHSPTGTTTITLANRAVTFGPGVSSTAPAPGSRVKLHGTITRLPGKCSTTGFTPTIVVYRAEIKAKK